MESDGSQDLDEIRAECARIGFDMSELGGLAISDEDALTSFRNLLHQVPTGVGLEGFRQRMRGFGMDLRTAAEELTDLEVEGEPDPNDDS